MQEAGDSLNYFLDSVAVPNSSVRGGRPALPLLVLSVDANLTQHAPPVASPDSAAGLTSDERDRYRRQLTLPSFGLEGQERLKTSRVLIVGAGGLGSPAALYLAAAGVGTIGLVDHDVVDITNLHRQLLHGTSDVGRDKLASARDRLRDINPLVQVVAHDSWLTSANAMDIIANYDLVIDGADNFATRYLVNDACVLLGRPNVHGSVFRFDGQASVFGMPDGPCYRCLYPEPPPPEMVPNCAEGAYSVCCLVSWGPFRPPKPSRCCSASARHSPVACS